jgi:hypothetical protein
MTPDQLSKLEARFNSLAPASLERINGKVLLAAVKDRDARIAELEARIAGMLRGASVVATERCQFARERDEARARVAELETIKDRTETRRIAELEAENDRVQRCATAAYHLWAAREAGVDDEAMQVAWEDLEMALKSGPIKAEKLTAPSTPPGEPATEPWGWAVGTGFPKNVFTTLATAKRHAAKYGGEITPLVPAPGRQP